MDINVLAVQQCTQLAIKSMLKNKINDGQIIIIGSLRGHQIYPNSPKSHFYAATKFVVTALVEGWRQELRSISEENRIRIATISPGMVKTGIIEAAINVDKATADSIWETIPHLSSIDVANSVKFILESPPNVQVHDILVRPTQQTW